MILESKKSVLFISSQLPSFDKDSGSNRLKEILKIFIELEYNCFFLVDNLSKQDKYLEYFTALGIKVISKENNSNYFEQVKQIGIVNYTWFNGPNSFKKNIDFIIDNFNSSKIIYDMVDIHFLRFKRALSINPFQISNYKRYFKYKKIETKLVKKADILITISENEKEIMNRFFNSGKTKVISNVHYSKIDINKTLLFEERNDILFIGSSHTPNIDALYYLYEKIMPIVWKKLPNLKVNIIGNIDKKISNINHPNVIFHGYVPEIESYFNSAKLMVAPLRYGAGVKGKIGQAFEYYLPLVTTNIGAEGMFLKHNENALIAENAEDFAKEIINLYENKNLWLKLQNNSEESLKPFSREILGETLKRI